MTTDIVQNLTDALGGNLSAPFVIFIISLLPILELRGGLIAASLLHVPWIQAYCICLVGNLLPIPFILLLFHKILRWMKNGIRPLQKLATWIEHKGEKNKSKVEKYKMFGLFLFVAIPLPGTGAWTGSIVASMLNIPVKQSFPMIALGVVCAGVIMSLLSYALPSLFR